MSVPLSPSASSSGRSRPSRHAVSTWLDRRCELTATDDRDRSSHGGRPGALGLARFACQVVAHLAATDGMTMTDSIVQQALGHDIAEKLSSRLGEGVLNGFLTRGSVLPPST